MRLLRLAIVAAGFAAAGLAALAVYAVPPKSGGTCKRVEATARDHVLSVDLVCRARSDGRLLWLPAPARGGRR